MVHAHLSLLHCYMQPPFREGNIKKQPISGVPVVAQWLTNLTRNNEVAGSIPGLAQWVKDLALLSAVVWVADSAWIWRCCGCGVGHGSD